MTETIADDSLLEFIKFHRCLNEVDEVHLQNREAPNQPIEEIIKRIKQRKTRVK